jgi:hypothetical protein
MADIEYKQISPLDWERSCDPKRLDHKYYCFVKTYREWDLPRLLNECYGGKVPKKDKISKANQQELKDFEKEKKKKDLFDK